MMPMIDYCDEDDDGRRREGGHTGYELVNGHSVDKAEHHVLIQASQERRERLIGTPA